MKYLWNTLRILLVLMLSGILFFPLAILLFYSITDMKALQQILRGITSIGAGHRLIAFEFDIRNYLLIGLESKKFSQAFLNSLTYSLFATCGQLFIAIPGTIALSVLKIRGRSIIISVYLIIMMMPFQVTMVPSYLALRFFHMIDSPLAILIPQLFMPFSVVMLYLFMIHISDEVIEAAKVDGAGIMQITWHIVLPLIRHGIFSVGLIHFIDLWNMIEQPLVFVTTIDLMPLSILLRQSLEQNPSDVFVPAILFLLPIIMIYSLFYKYIVSGLQISFVAGRTEKQ